RLQPRATYTLMCEMHADGGIGYTAPGANNPFDYVDGEYARAAAFQRHTVRVYTMYQMPYGFATSVTYSYGSGHYHGASLSGAPTITIPADVAEGVDGPASITSGAIIPRNALHGLPLHKVDLRLTKDIR